MLSPITVAKYWFSFCQKYNVIYLYIRFQLKNNNDEKIIIPDNPDGSAGSAGTSEI
jgi:hypothetical protein